MYNNIGHIHIYIYICLDNACLFEFPVYKASMKALATHLESIMMLPHYLIPCHGTRFVLLAKHAFNLYTHAYIYNELNPVHQEAGAGIGGHVREYRRLGTRTCLLEMDKSTTVAAMLAATV